MAQGGSNKKIANRLVVASCAAVLAVYVAGYARTQSAANRLAAQVAERRAAVPAPERVTFYVPELRSRRCLIELGLQRIDRARKLSVRK
jgi:hypothetical protein